MEQERSAPTTHQGVSAQSAKSPWVAMLLEVLLPGGGSFYLERVRQGVIWLVSSLVAGAIAGGIAGFEALRGAVGCASLRASGLPCGPNPYHSDLNLILAAVIALIWLNIRLSVITNQLTDVEWARAQGRPPVSATRMVGVGMALALCALGLWAWYFALTSLGDYLEYAPYFLTAHFVTDFANDFLRLAFVAAGVYLLALRRLARVPWWRALAEALTFTLAVWAIWTGLDAYSLAAVGVGVNIVGLLHGWSPILVELAIVATLSVSFALWAAPWRSTRARLKAHSGGGSVYMLVLLVLTSILVNTPTGYYAIQTGFNYLNDYGRNLTWCYVGAAALLAMLITGSIREARRLNRLASQP